MFGLACTCNFKFISLLTKTKCLSQIIFFRFCATDLKNDLQRIRNIGIIAHIDAGKTTTTERMLFYSGFTNFMGEVHEGNTVMDFMKLERERGITISSAAITFLWKNHKINLIDTPGHVDFTFEVERSLAVLEGAIMILDASAGVEVQTLKVWNQANRYNVPCIVYLNKMDKPASDVDMCLTSLKKKLKVKPFMLHIPIGCGKKFIGVVDIVTCRKILWKNSRFANNRCDYIVENLNPENDVELFKLTMKNRERLIENIIDLDDLLAEKYIHNGIENLNVNDIQDALRRITLQRTAVPVLCGSSYKNVGVQLLMDAIVQYLPTPLEKKHFISSSDDLCAFAFKICHKNKYPLTYLRIYSGSLKSGQKIYNINRDGVEKIEKLSIAYADNFKETSFVSAGNIVVVHGLKHVVTGDLLFSSTSTLNKYKNLLVTDKEKNILIEVPMPVFFCTIEPPSAGFQKHLETALACLEREDPTFRVEVDETLSQTIIMGMGELHIDVIKERIKSEYGVDAYLGPLLVAYKETLDEEISHTHILDKVVGGSKHYVKITLRMYPNKCDQISNVNVIVTKENGLGKLRMEYLKAINSGVKSAFNNGPIINFPVINVAVDLLWFETSRSTLHSMITAAASQCIISALKKAKMHLLEPVMKLHIIVDKGYAGRVINDLSQKRSQILSMEPREDVEIIESKTPLSQLRGYSTNLRAITSGRCSFTMEFECYEKLDQLEQAKAVEEVTGFQII